MTKRTFLSALLLASFLATGCSTEASSTPNTPTQPSDPGDVTTPQRPTVHEEKYTIAFACPEREIPFVERTLEKFLEDNDWINVTVKGEAYSTGEIASRVKDWEKGPDLYAFSSDTIGDLLAKGALDFVPEGKESLDKFAIGSDHFAYPYSGDNGYFLYYDKELFAGKEDKLRTIEGILDVCQEAGRQLCYPLEDPYFSMAFLQSFGAGYDIRWNPDEKRVSQQSSDFASEEGLLAAKAMLSLVQDPLVFSTTATAAPSQFNGFGAVVDGSWRKENYIQQMGEENLGAVSLPSMTIEGKEAKLKSYLSYKMYGVNPLPNIKDSTRTALLHDLASYLASSEIQRERYQELNVLPVDALTGESCNIAEDSVEGALLSQGENAIVQSLVPEALWTAPDSLFALLESGEKVSDESLREELSKIDDLLTL